ncbi:helix-turn-helix domain-containing protein [Paenibacillus beijingensis]|uniref:HTH araC/xylS-type domain-containing protein n=1 Tax=Paenibacillus beijingensis TaxID=1126833 RepID=A0A0D5NPA3_9BACL|nr:helix-turn-helix domain-containing protein [Paenibacillus beijingensis]AJY76842.1 hypothetical protein VN24_22625 [Paenibacillus beijingensis]
MGNRSSRRIIFWKLIAFFVMLSFVTVILLTIIFRNIYMDATYQEVTRETRNSLNRISMDIGKLNEEVDYIYISVISNPAVENFLNRKTWDPYEEYKMRSEFSRFKYIHSKIHSMYIYSGKINYFVSTQTGGMDYAGFPDREIIHAGLKRKLVVSREIAGGTEAGRKVVSYVYTKFGADGKTVENSIVINVLDFSELNMLGSGENLKVLLIDQDGGIVSTDAQEPVASITRDPSRRQTLLGSRQSPESTKVREGGREYIVNRLALEDSNWSLVTIQDHDEITGFVREQTNQILYIGCGVLLLSAILIAFMARTIYSPIDRFIKRMTKSELVRKKNANGKNELDYIMDGVVDMLDRMKELSDHHETSRKELKTKLLQQILSGSWNESYVRAKASELGLQDDPVIRRVALLRIDEYGKVKDEHKHLYEATVDQIVKDTFHGRLEAESVTMPGGNVAVIASAEEPSDPVLLRSLLTEVQRTVFKALGRSLTVGIGQRAETLRELACSYEDAMNLSNQRLTAGYGRIFDEEGVNREFVRQHPYPLEVENALIDCIKLNKETEWTETLERLEDELRHYTYNGAHLILLQLAVVCIRTFNGIIGASRGGFEMQDYYREIDRLEVMRDWKEWFQALFARYRIRIEEMNAQRNSGKATKMIQEALEYIEVHYSDPNLNVDSIAEKFGYSANYFAKLFKETTGAYINDHIRGIKIGRAKNLLKETKLAVNEIAELTGYLNKNYFFYAFKKDTGMTPLSYRELNSV